MATKKKAPAKKSAKARKPAAKAAKKTTAKKSAGPAVKKKAAAPAKPAAKKASRKPAKKKTPQLRSSPPGIVTFVVQVGNGTLTVEYDGSSGQALDMVLFVKDDAQKSLADEFIQRMAMREIVVGTARAYPSP